MATMAPTAAFVRSLPPGSVIKPSGQQIIAEYLASKVLRGDDGRVVVVPTPWLMKEYRLNKGAAVFRAAAARPGPKANMDCVVRKIFANPPPPPPPFSSDENFPAYVYPGGADEDAGYVGYRLEEEPARKRARF